MPRSRSMRPPGGGVRGGVIVAIGGMGNILMLSSASAPSRVPQVVYRLRVSIMGRAMYAGLRNIPLSL